MQSSNIGYQKSRKPDRYSESANLSPVAYEAKQEQRKRCRKVNRIKRRKERGECIRAMRGGGIV